MREMMYMEIMDSYGKLKATARSGGTSGAIQTAKSEDTSEAYGKTITFLGYLRAPNGIGPSSSMLVTHMTSTLK